MIQAGNGGGAVVQVRGAWQGAVGDPGRGFAGVVLASDLPEVRAGEAVTVAYHVGASRTSRAGEHGLYVMRVGEHELGLMRFICHDMGVTGQEGNDDTAEATWQAVILPG